jgi:hypothetical protein
MAMFCENNIDNNVKAKSIVYHPFPYAFSLYTIIVFQINKNITTVYASAVMHNWKLGLTYI